MAKQKKFSSSDIRLAAGVLHTQLAAGVMMRVAVQRMIKLQKSHAQAWTTALGVVESGGTLSEAMAGAFPESVLAGIRAGERTGNVAEVMGNIEESLAALESVKTIALKLLYPLGIVIGGVVVFLFFMIMVMPAITRSNPSASASSPVLALSAWMAQQVELNGFWILMSALGGLAGCVAFLSVPGNRQALLYQVDRIPVVGEALRSLWFGAWSYQMALLDRAGGIPVQECLRLSAGAMPQVYREGLRLMADEVVTRGLTNACVGREGDSSDPRGKWPFYVTLSFQMAHETGGLGEKLIKFAPAMVSEGSRSIARAASVANLLALFFAATLMVVPMAGYFTAIAASLKKAFA